MSIVTYSKHTAEYLWLKASTMNRDTWLSIGFMAVLMMICLIEPAAADIMTTITTKATQIKGGVHALSITAVVIAILSCIATFAAGNGNWRWALTVSVVAIILGGLDLALSFVGMKPADLTN